MPLQQGVRVYLPPVCVVDKGEKKWDTLRANNVLKNFGYDDEKRTNSLRPHQC